MSPDLKKCEARALKLPPKERAALAERLIASLDSLEDAENERLWVEEADRRYRSYANGETTARPAKDVLRDARSAIRQAR
jgi:putative addiction module component (TIGR02574 family)